MIHGAHIVMFSKDAEADRAFLRDVLGFKFVDAGHGWLIFALPPAEAAIHPGEENDHQELYLLSDDLKDDIAALSKKGVHCTEPHMERWGSITNFELPGGGTVGMYEPKHKLAIAKA
jgi:catechol 2,3-dioxygenase-like lactoylglutathione lyase family enzyme